MMMNACTQAVRCQHTRMHCNRACRHSIIYHHNTILSNHRVPRNACIECETHLFRCFPCLLFRRRAQDATRYHAQTAQQMLAWHQSCARPVLSVCPEKNINVVFNFPFDHLLQYWYCFYFSFDIPSTCSENAAHASKSQTKIGVRPGTDAVFWYKNTKNTFV